jgi:hypothetical protein
MALSVRQQMNKRELDAGFPVRFLLLLLSMTWLPTSARAQGPGQLQTLVPPHSSNKEADNACAMISAYSNMGVSDDAMKTELVMCSQDPDPIMICNTLLVVKLANRTLPAPRLVCTDRHMCEQYGLPCR